MKTIHILFLFFFTIPVCLFAQPGEKPLPDTGWEKVKDNVFRIVAAAPLFPDFETNGILNFQFERKIVRTVTGTAKMGAAFTTDRFGLSGDGRRFSFYTYSAVEVKYYYSHNRRVRKLRSILNNTGPYVGLEALYISDAFASINDAPINIFHGSFASYLNIGYQKQAGRFYISAHIGVLTGGSRISGSERHAAAFHGGTGIGYVF